MIKNLSKSAQSVSSAGYKNNADYSNCVFIPINQVFLLLFFLKLVLPATFQSY